MLSIHFLFFLKNIFFDHLKIDCFLERSKTYLDVTDHAKSNFLGVPKMLQNLNLNHNDIDIISIS